MAIIHNKFLHYLTDILKHPVFEPTFQYDPIIALGECCILKDGNKVLEFTSSYSFGKATIEKFYHAYKENGITSIAASYFGGKIVNQFTDSLAERKVYTLKRGYPNIPATKMATIMQGFGYDFTKEQILELFASYGQTRDLKHLGERFDFMDINRRIEKLQTIINDKNNRPDSEKIHHRYLAMRQYLLAPNSQKNKMIEQSEFGRGLFFHFWKSFKLYGFLGLIDKTQSGFRQSKIGFENEAKIIIDKIQHPQRKEAYYVEHLLYKGVKIDRSSIAKMLSRWHVNAFQSQFVSNLSRLEKSDVEHHVPQEYKKPYDSGRYVFSRFALTLTSLKKRSLYIDAPGLFVLWIYLEKFGIFEQLTRLQLATDDNGFCWFDHFLLNVARIFYGIPTYSKTSLWEEPSLRLFCMFEKLPCNDSFLDGLASIPEEKLFNIQKWLIDRLKKMGLIQGKRLAFDFHQIDIDVEFDRLRGIGKGPSPKKKICYNGFRPHICWDIDTGTIVVAEFRKASARGCSTFQRFVKDFLQAPLKDFFEKVYIDSEYTGKDVWNFILDNESGMGASLVACLKQNKFVKKYRDMFLSEFQHEQDFWQYYDDDHVFSSKTFKLEWQYTSPDLKANIKFSLDCVVKKNIKNGKLRCFGISLQGLSSKQILEEYSSRWSVENAIKDAIVSYYLDKCPGTKPHLVNVHFFCVSFCKQLYRLIQDDLGQFVKNADGSLKTLQTMRELIFRQGSAEMKLNNDTIEIHFQNDFTSSVAKQLNSFYQRINEIAKNGLNIIGGFKMKFFLKTAWGNDATNGLKKVKLNPSKIC
ncbi:MAG: transposase [bacterium]|nr:MAG: transposase [bacterium]